jgi:hypothetical protein
MFLGLLVACVYVIFRRSRARWRTALRMAEVFFGILIAVVLLASAKVPVVADVGGIAAMVGAIVAGLRHAGWNSRTELPDSPAVNER